ncbi:hypothetical protein [Crenobacter cavernae]|nr:hypothetical protein [Crenobacter cavernae]
MRRLSLSLLAALPLAALAGSPKTVHHETVSEAPPCKRPTSTPLSA